MIRRNAFCVCWNHCCENRARSHPQSWAGLPADLDVPQRAAQRSYLLSTFLADLSRALRSSKIWLFYKSNFIASWMHLHNCRCIQEHLRLLLESLRVLCSVPGGSGSISKYLEALVRSPGVSGRIACGFQADLHFADVLFHWVLQQSPQYTIHLVIVAVRVISMLKPASSWNWMYIISIQSVSEYLASCVPTQLWLKTATLVRYLLQ